MAKRKLFKYAQLLQFNNVFQYADRYIEENFSLKGCWHSAYFKNENPIVLELGCGKGEYTNALATMFPNKNFIGIDFKGDRLYAACKSAMENNLQNAVFIRTQIQFIELFFAHREVDEIWLTFPDPQIQKPRHRKRLTAPAFLNRYRNIAKNGVTIHLKTDNIILFDDTVGVLNDLKIPIDYITRDLYAENEVDEVLTIKTHYEKMFSAKGAKINYLKFRLT